MTFGGGPELVPNWGRYSVEYWGGGLNASKELMAEAKVKSTQEIDKVEIYSIHGSLLRTSLSDEINTSNLNTGQYLLKIYSSNDFVVKSIVVE